MPSNKRLLRFLALPGLAILLLWPAIVNRGPFFFPDTRTYMRIADAAVNRLTHKTTSWTAVQSDSTKETSTQLLASPQDSSTNRLSLILPSPTSLSRTRSLGTIKQTGFMYGRSLYYGLLLYLGAISGNFWLTIFLQACSVLLAVYLLIKSLNYPIWPGLAVITITLSVFSNVAFFTSFLMPDLFAGIVVLLCALLISVRRTLAAREYVPFYMLLAAGMLFHDSCGLISICFIAAAVIANALTRSWTNWRGLATISLAIITGLAGQQLFSIGVKRTMGEAPMRYPFLSARLVADGPGTAYLRAHCPASGFILCHYVNDFPMTSEDFLFGTEPRKTLFATASHADRLAISKEQVRFSLAVFKAEPVAVLETTARNSIGELLDFTLDDFQYDLIERHNMDRNMPIETLAQLHASAAYRNTMPITALSRLVYGLVMVSVIYLLLVIFGAIPGRNMNATDRNLLFWTVFGLMTNAVICGALSGVFPRYEARVIWLLPLLAIVVEYRAWSYKLPAKSSIYSEPVELHS